MVSMLGFIFFICHVCLYQFNSRWSKSGNIIHYSLLEKKCNETFQLMTVSIMSTKFTAYQLNSLDCNNSKVQNTIIGKCSDKFQWWPFLQCHDSSSSEVKKQQHGIIAL